MARKKAAASAEPTPTGNPTADIPEHPPAVDLATDNDTPPPPAEDATAPTSTSGPMPALGRGWTERYVQPVKYARCTFKDAFGTEHIVFRFDLPPGVFKPGEDVLEVVRDHKYFKHGRPNGLAEDAKSDPESYATGLHYDALPRGGKGWLLPNTPLGRTVADSLDEGLDRVAKRKETAVGGPG